MAEKPSFLEFAIQQAIAEDPEQAAAEMIRLLRREAELEAELELLRSPVIKAR